MNLLLDDDLQRLVDTTTIPTLDFLLKQTESLHKHLCPRQVLGVRMSLYAGKLLDITLPQPFDEKRVFAFVETDGCFADGVSVGSNCWLGRRTLRLMDYGKTAVTFVDTKTNRALRVYPHPQSRTLAKQLVPDAQSRWHAMLTAYQTMPNESLLAWQSVTLTISMQNLISRAGVRINCAICGEEIINEREIIMDGNPVCRSCAGDAYYSPS